MDDVSLYMTAAWQAASCSPDLSTQNGSTLVRGSERFQTGYNHFPEGTKVTEELLNNRDLKLAKIVHAECDVLLNAGRHGCGTEGSTLYCLWAACPRCAAHIVQAGVKKLVRMKWYTDNTPERWREDCLIGDETLRDGGVEIVEWEGWIDSNLKLRFDGSLVNSCDVYPKRLTIWIPSL